MVNERKLFESKFSSVLDEAWKGEKRCLNGKRWYGNPLLIVVDAALDSIGLNYFQIVIPRVKNFHEGYVKTGQLSMLEDLTKLSPDDPRLKRVMDYPKVWHVAINVCKELKRIQKQSDLLTDFSVLRYWAENADYKNWRRDPIGKIHGVGLITFQYLRLQAGIDTTVPDKIIKRVMYREFCLKTEDDIEFIKELEEFSRKIGYSQILICWAIWLLEAASRFDITKVE